MMHSTRQGYKQIKIKKYLAPKTTSIKNDIHIKSQLIWKRRAQLHNIERKLDEAIMW